MKTNVTDKIYWTLSIVFLGIYFGIIYKNTNNVPRWDDFSVFFQFLCDYIESSSFAEKMDLIFLQHGEHRKLLTRIITLLDYWLTGKVNLCVMIVIGNLFLLGIGAMFFAYVREKKNAGIFVFMTVLLIYNGQNFETSTWAMGGLQDMAIVFMAMLSVYFVTQPAVSWFVTGLVFSVITIFSHGNGMCLLPSILLSFLLLKKEKEKTVWFTVIAGIAIAYYFCNWEIESQGRFIGLLYRIPSITMSFFHFLGGNLWIPSAKIIACLWGVFIFATYIWAIVGEFYKKNIAWFTFFTFMLLTAAMVALNRSADEIAPLRYRVHCCMATVLAVMFYYENREALRLTRLFKFSVLPAMLFSVFCSMLYLDKCEKYSEYKKVTAFNWQRDKSGLCPNNANMEEILQRAEDMHIYTMPQIPLAKLTSTVMAVEPNRKNHSSNISYNIDFLEETGEYILIKGWAYTDDMNMDFTDIFLWMSNEKQNIKIRPYVERRYDLHFNTMTQESCGFFAVIPKIKFPEGNYNMSIEIQKRYIIPVKSSAKFADTEILLQIIK
jgi:hypothetical protein